MKGRLEAIVGLQVLQQADKQTRIFAVQPIVRSIYGIGLQNETRSGRNYGKRSNEIHIAKAANK